MTLVREDADSRSVALQTHSVEVMVEGRERDLVRMIRNLLENAVAHAPEGSSVELAVGDDGEQVTLDVVDQGPGIAEEEREQIFEPFFRSRSRASSNQGAGLGLGIARDIARSHGGSLVLMPRSATSTLTCFRVTLRRSTPES